MTVWVNHAERERVRERVYRFGRNRYVSDMADGRAVTKLHLNFNPQKECLVEREREKLSVFVLGTWKLKVVGKECMRRR